MSLVSGIPAVCVPVLLCVTAAGVGLIPSAPDCHSLHFRTFGRTFDWPYQITVPHFAALNFTMEQGSPGGVVGIALIRPPLTRNTLSVTGTMDNLAKPMGGLDGMLGTPLRRPG